MPSLDNDSQARFMSWPPPGHASTYTMTMTLGAETAVQFEMTVPENGGDFSTVIVNRLGGPSPKDAPFRTRLYFAVGALTVASGHVEAAMKRLLLTLDGSESNEFSLVDKTWTDLHRMLASEAEHTDPSRPHAALRNKLAKHLAWAEDKQLKVHRDNFIHGSIWDFDTPRLIVSRWTRRSNGSNLIGGVDEIETVAKYMHEYSSRLDYLLHGIWAEAMLPEG